MLDYHRELIGDATRTDAFREAILRTVRPGDVVVDLGCGSGILSFFACQAGAARVYAIDNTSAADAAAYMATQLGFGERITVLQKESREVELPERADVLISETMGVLGFDEGIAGSVRDARARLVKRDARIVPSRVAVWLVPVEVEYDYDRHVAFWNEPRYGLDLTPLRFFASNAVHFAYIRDGAWLAEPAELFALDLTRHESDQANGRATFTATRHGRLHGFGGYFSATLADGIELTNRQAHATSWAQAYLPLELPVAIRQGMRIDVQLQMDDGKGWRWRGSANGEEFDQTTLLALPPAGL